MLPDVERQFVEAFVRPDLRERYLLLLAGKQRKKQLNRLYHRFDFIGEKSRKLAIREGDDRSVLQDVERGVKGRCHVLSLDDEIDGREMDFEGWLKEAAWIPHGSVFFWPLTTTALIRTEYEFYLLTQTVR